MKGKALAWITAVPGPAPVTITMTVVTELPSGYNCTVGCSAATLEFDELSCTVRPFTNPVAPRSGVMGLSGDGAAADKTNASKRVPPTGITIVVGDIVIVAATGTC